jgi:predicted Zn-dependent protease
MDKSSRTTGRRFRGLLVGSIVILLLVAAAAALLAYRRSHPRDAYGYYAAGVRSLETKDFPRAIKLLAEAVRLEPTNAAYLDGAFRAAAIVGQKDDALRYAQMAWDNGRRTPEQLRLILTSLDRHDPTNQLARALALVSQLPPGSDKAELKGDAYFYFGRIDLALTNWIDLLSTSSSSRLAVKTAQALLAAKQQEKAISLLEGELSKNKLDENGCAALATIYSMDDARYTNALRVFDQAKRGGRYSEELKLAHAVTYLINQQAGDARPLLDALKQPADDQAFARTRINARLFLGAILLSQQDRKGIEELAALNRHALSSPVKEAEGVFYRSLLMLLDKKGGALDLLRSAHRLAPEHPAIALVFASESSKAGNYSDAITACSTIRGPVSKWPALMLELASALQKDGKHSEALRVLSQLHARKFHSKQSLSLFRDAAYASNLVRDSQRTQAFLEQRFPDDPDVKFFSGYAALRQRDYEKATAIFRELDEKFPQQSRYKLAEAQVLMARGDARSALEALQKIEAPPELMAPFLGIAHARLQEWDKALEAFGLASKSPQPAGVLVEYGMVLLQVNRPSEAARQFDQAFAKDARQIDARLGLALAAYSQGREQVDTARKHAALLLKNPELDTPRLLFLALSELRYAAYTNALEYCRLAITKDTNSVDAKALRGKVLASLGRFPDAEQDLLWAASRKPDDLSIRRELANLHLRSGQYEKGSNDIERLLAVRPKDTDFRLLKFDLLGRSGQLGAAQEFLGALRGSLIPAQFALCSSWLAQLKGDSAEAVSHLAPHLTNSAVAFQWGRLQFESGDAGAAVEKLRASRLDAAQWTVLAVLAERRKLTNIVVACYEDALALEPENPALLNNWAWSAAQLPKFDEGKVLAACRRALAGMPRNQDVLDTYADVLLRARRYEECINLLEANMTLVNQAPQLLWVLGSAYQATDDKKQALKAFQRCQSLLSTNSSIRFSSVELPKRIAQLSPGR